MEILKNLDITTDGHKEIYLGFQWDGPFPTDDYQIYRSWLDGGNHKITMPNQKYFTEYEFDCIDLSKFTFCTSWNYYGDRWSRSCEIVVYIDIPS